MVSYYNSLPYSQKHSPNLSYPPTQAWFSSNYHAPPNHQFLSEVDASHHQHMYYNAHMFHQAGAAEWHAHDTFQSPQTQLLGQNPVNSHLNESANSENLTEGLPSSPPITVSGSEISSPGAPTASSSPQTGTAANSSAAANNNNRPTPAKSPYYDWMKKPSYPSQPTPGKTRTKDKYRVVYTDFQRLELEKEYHTSRYITIRRKTELAQALQLSERQVKIWFQNRRAKERKQNKKREDPLSGGHAGDLVNLMDTKPKLEPGLHLQHSLHQMSSMAMGMSPMSLHHPVLHHGHLTVPPPPPSQLHQTHPQMSGAVAALSM